MPVSATAGPSKTEPDRPSPSPSPATAGARRKARQSLLSKIIALSAIFLLVPVVLYAQFRSADQQKRQLVMASVRDQGRLAAQSLAPLLTSEDHLNLPEITRQLGRFQGELATIKLLYRPSAGAPGFYYVGSSEPISNDTLDYEREQLREQGVLSRLQESCAGTSTVSLRYRAPDGHDEVVISVVPVQATNGCWAVVTSLSAMAMPSAALDVPYYATPEIKLAGVIYLAMATLTFTTLWSLWRGLLQFGERARAIRARRTSKPSFVVRNDVPELAGVAAEFDRMVETLQGAARDLRRTAEDNAHAYKTPVAIIRQSLEPVARALPTDHTRAHRALGLIEQSLDKLDALVTSSRQLDEAAAALLETPRIELDLSVLVKGILTAHTELFRQREITLRGVIEAGVVVRGNEDMLETVIENVLENAVSFSASGSSIGVNLSARGETAELTIADQGPGVKEGDLRRIFDRYYSARETGSPTGDHSMHFGVGLWIVRRNIEAVGGTVVAENREPHGLLMRISMPRRKSLPPAPAHKT